MRTMTGPPKTARRAVRLRYDLVLLMVVGVLLLSSCAAGPNTAAGTGEDPAAGFFIGVAIALGGAGEGAGSRSRTRC
jgi:predicted small secreted protein